MSKKANIRSAKQRLIRSLHSRIRLLENGRQHYAHHPTLMKNLKMANVELVQNNIETLKKMLRLFRDSCHTKHAKKAAS